MTTHYPKIILLSTLALLTGCAQNHEVPKLHNQVVALNQQLTTLTNQATALEQQNQLNKNSTSGVYLLPAANNAARLQSSLGELSVSLSHVKTEANGTQALLHVRTLSQASLPAFKAVVEWGQLDPATGKPLATDSLSQPIASADSLLPKSEHTFELRFSGLAPEQLGFVRLHSVEPVTVATAQN
ncbi:SadB/YajI family lipoprotein [Serratia grimesii]|uniref:DUF3251 domain-containing protein n=1 Tax=Serratia grimesii TaxID=82995 RepID=A0ABR4U5B5_9GAMM|nr:DUF3251 domain-containing protein [Serratia grimesii]KFB87244.1 hypothetical protein CR62_14310 [Serratia grimesii]CAI0725244.1 Uncharacterized lipoprotein yajI precursor [Serratia grimesii]CAI0825203.1 Uncharacterized lipoprotein yajI precursor [Serratia grimesii]CAI2471425.1 Uncharacterized lipoprotein yajI precursor [Serratia grimesii]SUI31748.1 Uncharacterized lipoprotein yajI precursor [Serratia grimesii]